MTTHHTRLAWLLAGSIALALPATASAQLRGIKDRAKRAAEEAVARRAQGGRRDSTTAAPGAPGATQGAKHGGAQATAEPAADYRITADVVDRFEKALAVEHAFAVWDECSSTALQDPQAMAQMQRSVQALSDEHRRISEDRSITSEEMSRRITAASAAHEQRMRALVAPKCGAYPDLGGYENPSMKAAADAGLLRDGNDLFVARLKELIVPFCAGDARWLDAAAGAIVKPRCERLYAAGLEKK